jgi:hypothetical protein
MSALGAFPKPCDGRVTPRQGRPKAVVGGSTGPVVGDLFAYKHSITPGRAASGRSQQCGQTSTRMIRSSSTWSSDSAAAGVAGRPVHALRIVSSPASLSPVHPTTAHLRAPPPTRRYPTRPSLTFASNCHVIGKKLTRRVGRVDEPRGEPESQGAATMGRWSRQRRRPHAVGGRDHRAWRASGVDRGCRARRDGIDPCQARRLPARDPHRAVAVGDRARRGNRNLLDPKASQLDSRHGVLRGVGYPHRAAADGDPRWGLADRHLGYLQRPLVDPGQQPICLVGHPDGAPPTATADGAAPTAIGREARPDRASIR